MERGTCLVLRIIPQPFLNKVLYRHSTAADCVHRVRHSRSAPCSYVVPRDFEVHQRMGPCSELVKFRYIHFLSNTPVRWIAVQEFCVSIVASLTRAYPCS